LEPLVKDFFSNPFPGFKNKVKINDDLLTTEVPVVELPLDIDVAYLLDLVKSIPTDPCVRKIYPYETYPRIQGWEQTILWHEGNVQPVMDDVYYKQVHKPLPVVKPNQTGIKIKQIISQLGIECELCMLSILRPDGYIRPHRDINLIKESLGYFWLPLNNTPGNELKIYPYGTVSVTLGNMYLLNQRSFTHAAINTSDQTRYVIIGWFKHTSKELEQIIHDQIIKLFDTD
jgi:hypothetical protein